LKFLHKYLHKKKRAYFLLSYLLVYSLSCFSQITTSANADAQQLVESILGKGFVVSNAKLTCPTGSSGTFVSTTSNIGLGKGILLSSGGVAGIGDVSSNLADVSNQAPGDIQLGDSMYDACRLEFDLLPSCDTLKFKYVFASEEYPDYVGAINDAFAFFISGPGITGTVNIATLPNSTTQVNINNINAITNSKYFVDNGSGQSIIYNGFTVPLSANVKVIPCSSYHLVLIIADAGDAQLDSGVFIEGNSLDCTPPEIISPAVCANQPSIDLCAPTGYVSYKWPAGQLGAVPPFDKQCVTINNPHAGDTYIVNMIASGGGCPVIGKMTLKGSDFIAKDTVVCKGSSKFPLSITPLKAGKYTFRWQPATNLSCTTCESPVFDPVSTQTYTITMTDQDVTNCDRVRKMTVTVDTGFAIQVSSAEICEGEIATLTATGADTYVWEPGSLTGVTLSSKPVTTTTYTVTGTLTSGPCPGKTTAQAIATIKVKQKPVVKVTDKTSCSGQSVNLNGIITAGASKGTWVGGSGLFSPDRSALNALYTPTQEEEIAGTVKLLLKSEDSQFPCTNDSNSMTLSIIPAAKVDVGKDQVICMGDTVQLIATISDSAQGGTWSGGTGTFLPNTQSRIIKYIANSTDEKNGKVNLVFTYTNPAYACLPVSDTLIVGIHKMPVAFADSLKAICAGDLIQLHGLVNGIPTGGSWGGGKGVYLNGKTDLNTTYQPSDEEIVAGKVNFVLITDSAGVCPLDTAITSCVINPKPIVKFSADTLKSCPPHCINFFDSTTAGATTIVKWDWDFGNGTFGKIKNPTRICYPDAGFYNISLTATSDKGCVFTQRSPNFIETFKKPLAKFTADPNSVPFSDPTIQLTDLSSSTVRSWTWNLGDGKINSSSVKKWKYQYPIGTAGFYIIHLIVKDGNGCWDSTSRTVRVEPEFMFYMPSAFTPGNKDGKNDTFFGKGIGVMQYELLIFDRWGNLVFNTTDINEGWDGHTKKNEEIIYENVYVWKVKLKDVFGREHNYIGKVNVVK
jgi:gliding motility-associated-like protein